MTGTRRVRSRGATGVAVPAVALAVVLAVVVTATSGCGMEGPGPAPPPAGADSEVHGGRSRDAAAPPPTSSPPTAGPEVTVAADGFEAFTDPGAPPTAPLPLAPEVRAGSPLSPGAQTVFAIGDSVLLATQATLPIEMGGWTVVMDARVSRRMSEGVTILDRNRGRLTQVVVILLGHNYGPGENAAGWLESMLAFTGSVERLVLVTVAEWSSAQREVNAAIHRAASTHDNVVVADWAAVVKANPRYLASDGVHLTQHGAWALAQLIATVTGPLPPRGAGPFPALPIVPPSSTTTRPPTTTPTSSSSSSSSSSSTTRRSTTTTRPRTTTSSSSTTSTSSASTTTSSDVTTTSSEPAPEG